MNVVFAQGSEHVPLPDGGVAVVLKGQHWPATDQVVRARPALFTTDPRFGLMYSEAPPGYDAELNELEDFEDTSAAPGEKRSVRRPRAARTTEIQQDGEPVDIAEHGAES